MAGLGIIKAAKYVGFALAALEEEAVLSSLITRIDGNGFVGALNDTINYKLKRVAKARDYEFRTRVNPIVLDDITQLTIDIKLDTHVYSGVPITDEELTLDVTEFVEEIVRPQAVAVVDRAENKVKAALAAAPFVTDDIAILEADDPYDAALDVRQALNDQKAPSGNRTWLVGSAVERWILGSDRISKPEYSGSTSALREATVGRIAGLTVVANERLNANEWYAFHPSALVLANLAPAIPQGVTYGARRRDSGWSIRVIRDYDPNYLRDRSILSTFMGISSINDDIDGTGALTDLNPRGVTGTFTPTP